MAHVEIKSYSVKQEEILADKVRVEFEIDREPDRKRCCHGYFIYTLVNLKNGRAEKIPDWIAARYSV